VKNLEQTQKQNSYLIRPKAGVVNKRIYVNASADHALGLFKRLQNEIVSDPKAFPGVAGIKLSGPTAVGSRANNLLIYHQEANAERRDLDWLKKYGTRYPEHFVDGRPEFTAPVQSGVALGDKPYLANVSMDLCDQFAINPNRVSFGSLRFKLITVALREGKTGQALAERIRELFRLFNFNPDRPHLNLGS
jgi:hypothetical protein